MMSSSPVDSDLALAIQLQEQFYKENALANKPKKKKKVISLIDSDEDDDYKCDSVKENDFEFAKNLQMELNRDDSLDFNLALKLQNELNSVDNAANVTSKLQNVKNIVDDNWELIDPNPNVHSLFWSFNDEYFYGKLKSVEVRWSPRMTLCAGLCCYEGKGGLCSIRLSEPLLKLRPRKDLVETLLHEMIHAYLFVTGNNKDHDAHGYEFHQHMNRINSATGAKITVYHSFHDEVDLYKVHWWRCNGPCREKPPYFGYVKRTMNRPPQPADTWWKNHLNTCGGQYTKIKGPDVVDKKKSETSDNRNPKKAKHSPSNESLKPSTSKDIRSYFDGKKNSNGNSTNIHSLFGETTNTSAKQNNEKLRGSVMTKTPSVKKGSPKGLLTKMNSSSTVTLKDTRNGKFLKNCESVLECNTGSNVFTINSFSTNSPEKKNFHSFSGHGRSLGSS